MKTLVDKFKLFEEKISQSHAGGGQERIKRQHEAGKKTARERIDLLLDPGTFVELDQFASNQSSEQSPIPGDGVISGYGKVEGRLIYVYAYDFTVFGGTLSRTNANKIIKVQQMAVKMGAPIVGLNDSGGARIQEGVQSLAGYADIFFNNVRSSGVIPQITCIMGPCAGGAVYSPALNDFIIMVKDTSYMFVTGPDVIKTVTHEEVTKEELGGAISHNSKSGVAHFIADSDEQALMQIRELLAFLPSNNMEEAPVVPTIDPVDRFDERLQELVPADPNKPYDIKDLISGVIDDGIFLEVHPLFAKNIVVGFARLGGGSWIFLYRCVLLTRCRQKW